MNCIYCNAQMTCVEYLTGGFYDADKYQCNNCGAYLLVWDIGTWTWGHDREGEKMQEEKTTFERIREKLLCRIKDTIEDFASERDDLCYGIIEIVYKDLFALQRFGLCSRTEERKLGAIVELVLNTYQREKRWMEYDEYSHIGAYDRTSIKK